MGPQRDLLGWDAIAVERLDREAIAGFGVESGLDTDIYADEDGSYRATGAGGGAEPADRSRGGYSTGLQRGEPGARVVCPGDSRPRAGLCADGDGWNLCVDPDVLS